MNKKAASRAQRGFSLIEIMVVVVIMGILVSLVAPNILGNLDSARAQAVKADFSSIGTALDMYRMDNYSYPSSDQGLEALVSKPSGEPSAKNWRDGGYLKELPKDPWDNPYKYIAPGQNGEYDLYTLGADNATGGEGANADIGNWAEES